MNVICFSDITWNFLWQRQQQVVSRFPDDWKILYIEPSFWLSLAWSIINSSLFDFLPHKVQSNIRVMSIPTIPFVDRFEKFRKINNRLIIWWTRFLMKKYGIEKPVLFFYKPRYSCVLGKLNENLICYDVTDDVLEFEASAKWMLADVNLLIKNSDLVIVSSEHLYQKLLPSRKEDLFLIGNGVDIKHFRKVPEGDLPRPADTNNIQSPILGYVGAIGEWFDFKILDLVLKKYPHVSIVMIGWVFGKQKKEIQYLTKKYSNLHFLGRKTYEELPQYVNIFDACLIPFRIYPLTMSVNPIKFYEYLAAGKQVIATSLPELEKYKDIVYFAQNHEEFVSFIESALSKKPDIEKLLDIAKENDWQINVTNLINLIDDRVSAIGKNA